MLMRKPPKLSEVASQQFKQREVKLKKENYNIDKKENEKIKIHPERTAYDLLNYGFVEFPNYLSYYRLIHNKHEISFSIRVDKDTLEILKILVIDDDFGQPYDYQQFIMSGKDVPDVSIEVFDEVDKLMTKLQDDQIIIGYRRGMYL